MWQETFEEIDLPSTPKAGIFKSSLSKEGIDTFSVFCIIITSTFILFLFLKFRIFYLWIDFLTSTPLHRSLIIPLLISGEFIVIGILFRTILWIRYKPQIIETEDKIDWPFLSVILPVLMRKS